MYAKIDLFFPPFQQDIVIAINFRRFPSCSFCLADSDPDPLQALGASVIVIEW